VASKWILFLPPFPVCSFSCVKAGNRLLRLATGAWRCLCGRPSHPPLRTPRRAMTQSHPPDPWAVVFTHRPTDCFAIVYPGRALSPGRWRPLLEIRSHHPSKLAYLSFLMGRLGCFQLRAWTSTAFLKIRLVWCARSASKGSCLAYPFTVLRSQAATGPCGFTHRGAGGDHPPSPLSQNDNVPSTTMTHCPPTFTV
jgi:hypothetical protein